MRRFLSSCRTTLDRSSWDRISFCRGDRAGAAILRPAACARASRAGLARRPHGLDGGITTGVGGAAGLFRRIPRRLRHFAPFLLFEPELLEGLTPTFACFPRILSGVPALLGVVPGGFGGQTLVLGGRRCSASWRPSSAGERSGTVLRSLSGDMADCPCQHEMVVSRRAHGLNDALFTRRAFWAATRLSSAILLRRSVSRGGASARSNRAASAAAFCANAATDLSARMRRSVVG